MEAKHTPTPWKIVRHPDADCLGAGKGCSSMNSSIHHDYLNFHFREAVPMQDFYLRIEQAITAGDKAATDELLKDVQIDTERGIVYCGVVFHTSDKYHRGEL